MVGTCYTALPLLYPTYLERTEAALGLCNKVVQAQSFEAFGLWMRTQVLSLMRELFLDPMTSIGAGKPGDTGEHGEAEGSTKP